MKKISLFYLENCPYCRMALRALEELAAENPAYREIPLTRIEESEQPVLADRYDYYRVPTFFVGEDKLFEARVGMGYEQIRAGTKLALDAALD